MTVQQISEWIEAFNRSLENAFKSNAILLDGQAQQIVSGVGSLLSDKNKHLTLQKLYPNVFGNKSTKKILTDEEKELQGYLTWKAFLGI